MDTIKQEGVEAKEKFLSIINQRLEYFDSKHQSYEALQIGFAKSIIIQLIPPENFAPAQQTAGTDCKILAAIAPTTNKVSLYHSYDGGFSSQPFHTEGGFKSENELNEYADKWNGKPFEVW